METTLDRYCNDNPENESELDFFEWLKDNEDILLAFFDKAEEILAVGKTKYSARTIVEVLRWESDLSEKEGQYKLNNNWTAHLSRTFDDERESKGQEPLFFKRSMICEQTQPEAVLPDYHSHVQHTGA